MNTEPRTKSLDDFMKPYFPSQQEAIMTVWKMDPSELPASIRDLPEDRIEALVACYADNIALTMTKYPEQLAQGYLRLCSCDPKKPELATDYAKNEGKVLIGTDMPDWRFGYSAMEESRPSTSYWNPDRKPLFVPIERLETKHMPEKLKQYMLIRSILDIAKKKLVA